MSPKLNRLKNKKDFKKVLRRGKGLREDFLILKFVKNNLPQTRIGFIVGIKVSKRATLRNKVRRRLRELVKKEIDNLKNELDIVLIAQPGLENKDFWEIEEILNKLFKKAKIIKNG